MDDRRIAVHLRRSSRILTAARKSLRRWMAGDGAKTRPVYQEWNKILTLLSRHEIADFLVSGTPMCRRLQQSSPFMGLLPDDLKQSTKRRHDKAGT
jgi:hypothetical protein